MIAAGSSALCCAGQAFCSNLCSCCFSCCKTKWKAQIRLAYIVLNLLATLFIIILFYLLRKVETSWITSYVGCPETNDTQTLGDCLGASSVYRMSFALIALYLILILINLLCCSVEFCKTWNEGVWCFKVTIVIGVFILMFFVDNSVLFVFVEITKYASLLYLAFQSLVVIDLLYIWSQSWVKQFNDGNANMKYYLIFTAFILYASSLTLNILNFIWFEGCGANSAISSINLVITIAITAVQIIGWNPNGSLIASGGVSFYVTFWTFSSQFSSPSDCNSLVEGSNGFYFDLIVALILNMITLFYITFTTRAGTSKTSQQTSANPIQNAVLADDVAEEEDLNQSAGQANNKSEMENRPFQSGNEAKVAPKVYQQRESSADKPDEYEQKQNRKAILNKSFRNFFIVMAFISGYTNMLVTNWRSPTLETDNSFFLYSNSTASYWIKIICAWFAALIYLWTLVAPRLFPNRDFS